MQKTDWKTIGLLGVMYVLFLGNFGLYFCARLPLVLHVLIGIAAIHCSFTIWHEAIHGTVSENAAVNDAAGILGMFPYMLTPYYTGKWIHLMHHKNLNLPEDPNTLYTDGPFRTLYQRYPRAATALKRIIKNREFPAHEVLADRIFRIGVAGVFLALIFTGNFAALFWLWLVPLGFAKIIMDWYINYIPHVGLPADRYKGTRILDIAWLTPLVFFHNYHAIHHLWPTRPWHTYKSIFDEKRTMLKEHGVPIETSLAGLSYDPQFQAV
jgi:fatty acid desaturase